MSSESRLRFYTFDVKAVKQINDLLP